ncbi:hypothetical protein PL11_005730 [Lentilactobacillus curieae]|uniref:Uncharacterized protein n=1 Tax=Lentilactobacillus curieae TaxID=1138822 RepID=A0A1S6QIN2_9LACO|nr:hypothetical protein [Lentilactobacillus curieae]AQW21468.1 hypothetical protein PL11_005730 [Lentilactobacillus curieae]
MNSERLEDQVYLLREAVRELSDKLVNTEWSTRLLSLLCLETGITSVQRDSIVSGFIRLSESDENLEVSALPKYRKVVEDVLAGSQTLVDNKLVIDLLVATAEYSYHRLYELTDYLECGPDYDSLFDQTKK